MIVGDSSLIPCNYHSLSFTIMFAIKRSMIVDDSLSKSRNVLAQLLFISCLSRSQLHYHHSLQKYFPCFRYFEAMSCFWQPRFQCFLGDDFLLFLILLTFSFSASLSSKYSCKNFGFLLHRTIGFPLNPARQPS